MNGKADGEKSEHSNSHTSPSFLFEPVYPWWVSQRNLDKKKEGAYYRFDAGKIVEGWENADILGLFQQLGGVPAPGQAT